MRLAYKEDWEQARERYDAWWHGEIIDRALVQVVAPRDPASINGGTRRSDRRDPPDNLRDKEWHNWWFDPEIVIPRLERRIEATYWGGEAFPVASPVSGVAILAAYMGCPYHIHRGSNAGWADPIVEDWETLPDLAFDPNNRWWVISKRLLQAAAQRAAGRYYVSMPDLNGPGEIVSRLRSPEKLAIDLFEHPQEVKATIDKVNAAWLRYWEACHGMIHQWIGGYIHMMHLWSEIPSTDLQCDFSIMISPKMFQEFFLPAIAQQTEWVARTIYHLDGPGATRHLDALLALPKLDGIQWVPGAGAAPTSEWIPLLKRIQAAGKLIVASCEKHEVEKLLSELRPEGLLLGTSCSSPEEVEELLKNVQRWTARRKW
jgi:GNAT superfamily N-acetyltransferase